MGYMIQTNSGLVSIDKLPIGRTDGDNTWTGTNTFSGAVTCSSTLTVSSITMGAHTLAEAEWHYLDGQDQAVLTTSSPQFANIVITAGGDIKPSANSTSAINIAQADGTNFVTFDTTNKRIGFGTAPADYAPWYFYGPSSGLEVARFADDIGNVVIFSHADASAALSVTSATGLLGGNFNINNGSAGSAAVWAANANVAGYALQTATGKVKLGTLGGLLLGTAGVVSAVTEANYLNSTLLAAANTWTNTQYVNVSNAAALKVGSGPTFQVDTTSGLVGVNAAPTAKQVVTITPAAALTTTGSILLAIADSDKLYTGVGMYYGVSATVAAAAGNTSSGNLDIRGLSFLGYQHRSFTHTTGTPLIDLYGAYCDATHSNSVSHSATVALDIGITGGSFRAIDQAAFAGTGVVTDAQDIIAGKFYSELTPALNTTHTVTSLVKCVDARLSIDSVSYYTAGTLNLTVVGVDVIADTFTHDQDVIGTMVGYGFRVNLPYTAPVGNTGSALYGYYVQVVSGAAANWAFYNASAAPNLLAGDNVKTYFGTDADASIYYDATHLVINPQEVSAGKHLSLVGPLELTGAVISSVATGTPPYQCASTTKNDNLNADLLDGLHAVTATATAIPVIVDTPVDLTGQGAAITSTAIANTSTAGLYRVTFYMACTTLQSNADCQLTIAWNDGVARTFTAPSLSLESTGAYVNGVVGGTEQKYSILVKLTTGSITYRTAFVGTTARYSLAIVCERLL